jgi:hypothetical protein
MFYNSIILALTAVQVLAQDQYIPDDSSDGATIEGTTADSSPTAAPYVSVPSDGEATSTGASDSNNTSNMTDPSATGISGVPVNGDSAASSAATGAYTSYYTSPAVSDAGSQSEYSYNSSSTSGYIVPPAPSVPPTNPPVYLHIKFEKDPTKCLAIFDTSHQDNTPVK